MTQITERTHLLLIMVGEEGPTLEARDFNKIVTVISEYASANKPTYDQFLVDMLASAIRRVPLKQHIYAGLLSQLHKVNQDLVLRVFRLVVANLEKDLNALKLHESINGILFLSELMNLENLNSQCFLDLLDDIVVYLENTKNASHRTFFVLLFSRTLNNYCYSLNKKVYEFKKLLERAKKFCGKNTQFSILFEMHQKGTISDGSLKPRIYPQDPASAPSTATTQIQQNIKLKISIKDDLKFIPIEYHLPTVAQNDKLYQEYMRNQGALHLTNMEQILELMKLNGKQLLVKLLTYIKFGEDSHSFLQRYCIDFLIGKALKAKNTIAETDILVKLVSESRVYAGLVESALQYGLHHGSEGYDLTCQVKFAEIVSYVVNNWPVGGNSMTDIGLWDWEKFVGEERSAQQQNDKQKEKDKDKKDNVKRTVLLKLICAKLVLLNQNFKVPACLKKYAPPQDLKNPTKYKAIEQMETLQKFEQLLKRKADSSQVVAQIKTESDYQLFLQSLFSRTSQSHTHLEVLLSRYQSIFVSQKQDYDWSLLNTIRSYWTHSLFHRLLYLGAMIERGFVDFDSYVKYIAKVENTNQEDAHWVKLELSQVNAVYGRSLEL